MGKLVEKEKEMKTFKDYYTTHLEKFEKFDCTSSVLIDVLEFLRGRQWDDLVLAYVHALRPSSIRVTTGKIKCDARSWRVTIIIDDNNVIENITQEVEVGLPDGVAHGEALKHALEYGIDSPQVKWHLDCEGYSYVDYSLKDKIGEENCGYFKYTKDGKTVKFPETNK